ncbi:MAG TPA: hypothetical protein VK779_01875 [Rhizomicrobium sp.]|jgi:hypothetical protein|nr:hypothetical protein [Rhizomicrobium sp.]
MTRTDFADGPVQRQSGWLLPIAVFVITAALSAIFLIYYLRPSPRSLSEEQPWPTSDTEVVRLSVHGLALAVPSNYIIFRSARDGGPQKDVALFALLPDFHGYSDAEAQSFSSNAPDSQVIYLLVEEDRLGLSESERLQRIYLNYVAHPQGSPGPFGLTEYTFRDDSGYRGEDLFVGQTEKGTALFRCVRFSQDVPSPSCLRETHLAHGVTLSYRFKRAYLAHWREIGDGADVFIHGFVARAQ